MMLYLTMSIVVKRLLVSLSILLNVAWTVAPCISVLKWGRKISTKNDLAMERFFCQMENFEESFTVASVICIHHASQLRIY